LEKNLPYVILIIPILKFHTVFNTWRY